MKTTLTLNLRGLSTIYVKESTKTIESLLVDKSKYITVTRRRYNRNKIISERKVLLKKTLVQMVDTRKD